MTEVISYAYAVAKDDDGSLAEALTGLPGVAEAPVHLVRAGDRGEVVVAVSPVPEQDFQESALRANLEDLDWLESVARAHHRVIEALAARTTVLPLRLATVYLDDERVRHMVTARQEAFAGRLADLAAHTEWGVKIYVEAPAPTDRPAAPPADEGLSPGRAYLSHRKAQRHARDDAYRDAEEVARRVEAAARGHAVDRVQHRVQQGELARGPGENVVNDAYLVPLRDAESFRADVTRAAEGLSRVRVEVTGPWAPYSFATPPEAEPLKGAAP
ncbi:GvpL/GvpF family gas vesicle protein [Streptomyces sp. Je 1-4]|uniref:GvpL/GvpF family gas vesicle protein n=1 Tax=Streptomyces TaxID=1883 RepID=UPI0021DA9FF4|nr:MULTISPECIES: GvpL/GvpF family gas vesicle protein [unclassified Streptomyces]UYB43734.1 GvpL/GvpF family gas vesicle protein [Streptomyces sp. Je 1-4]UZQ40141.1 GvpL/GvpF family gas vesicle protein [Streptomyces sp. Je 1-4] [Streptomyces sp. Je 1-4 4N24]UZQ47558.1 GvpL/GvpF family gas vesicle protein [Streptomyces sp. Je 1-4] [Streptomyces sp. Je 1-4 4N24_ara]